MPASQPADKYLKFIEDRVFFYWQGQQHIEEEEGACLLVGNAASDLTTLPQSSNDLTNTSANFMDSPLTGDSDAS